MFGTELHAQLAFEAYWNLLKGRCWLGRYSGNIDLPCSKAGQQLAKGLL